MTLQLQNYPFFPLSCSSIKTCGYQFSYHCPKKIEINWFLNCETLADDFSFLNMFKKSHSEWRPKAPIAVYFTMAELSRTQSTKRRVSCNQIYETCVTRKHAALRETLREPTLSKVFPRLATRDSRQPFDCASQRVSRNNCKTRGRPCECSCVLVCTSGITHDAGAFVGSFSSNYSVALRVLLSRVLSSIE